MGSLLSLALPSYTKYVVGLILVVALGGYIYVLNEQVNRKEAMLETANAKITELTNEYAAAVAKLKASIDQQNTAIDALNQVSVANTTKVTKATSKAQGIGNTTDKEVQGIISKTTNGAKPKDINHQLLDTSDIQWDK